jgi:hypothetical protein
MKVSLISLSEWDFIVSAEFKEARHYVRPDSNRMIFYCSTLTA